MADPRHAETSAPHPEPRHIERACLEDAAERAVSFQAAQLAANPSPHPGAPHRHGLQARARARPRASAETLSPVVPGAAAGDLPLSLRGIDQRAEARGVLPLKNVEILDITPEMDRLGEIDLERHRQYDVRCRVVRTHPIAAVDDEL